MLLTRLPPTRAFRTGIPPLTTRFFAFTSRRVFPRSARTLPDKSLQQIPSFREELARINHVKSFSEQVERPSIRNQILLFVFGSYVAFSIAATQTNLDTDYWCKRLSGMSVVWRDRIPTNDEIIRTKYYELGKRLQGQLAQLKEFTAEFPLFLKNLILMGYVRVAQPYLDTTDGKRMCWKICAVNAAVWVAWHIPRFRAFMTVSFMHHPLSGQWHTLLTSVFSHKGIIHLLFNCMALTSFGTAASHFLTREQMAISSETRESSSKWHFLAFYISAGMFSGLVSHIISAKVRYPRLISQLASSPAVAGTATAKVVTTTAAKAPDILPSLGASGAIYAAVVMTALGFPDTEIALLIPPSFPIPIQYGVGCLVAMDILGAIRGWRYLDHWAHLGGAAFGTLYYAYGPQFWHFMRVSHQSSPQQSKSH